MAPKFDEVDLRRHADPVPASSEPASGDEEPRPPIIRRIAATLIDWSLFAALALAMSPLLSFRGTLSDTLTEEWPSLLGFSGFILLVAFYYSLGTWTIWGKTIGGAIVDVKLTELDASPVSVANAARRFGATLLSLAIAGLGFVPALVGQRRSLADRLSNTRCIRG